jgi:hypothetical protein
MAGPQHPMAHRLGATDPASQPESDASINHKMLCLF